MILREATGKGREDEVVGSSLLDRKHGDSKGPQHLLRLALAFPPIIALLPGGLEVDYLNPFYNDPRYVYVANIKLRKL